jgi:hypothetical protein
MLIAILSPLFQGRESNSNIAGYGPIVETPTSVERSPLDK